MLAPRFSSLHVHEEEAGGNSRGEVKKKQKKARNPPKRQLIPQIEGGRFKYKIPNALESTIIPRFGDRREKSQAESVAVC